MVSIEEREFAIVKHLIERTERPHDSTRSYCFCASSGRLAQRIHLPTPQHTPVEESPRWLSDKTQLPPAAFPVRRVPWRLQQAPDSIQDKSRAHRGNAGQRQHSRPAQRQFLPTASGTRQQFRAEVQAS